ncbi:MAG: hypothetical protein O7B30_01975 [Thaumarchaeota archaeon]|nr:hypothetical protein [Nitrososphaerota archaeon]
MPRRSVTIFDQNHENLQKIRGNVLLKGLDMDYTTGLNMTLQWGIWIVDLLTQIEHPAIIQGIAAYVNDPTIKALAANDKLQDKLEEVEEALKNELAKNTIKKGKN